MAMITHRMITTNGIQMHIAEAGVGPLVVLLHSFPEFWYSWGHQLATLSSAGYHAVAPDQRGYGQTDRPREVDSYTYMHLVGDVIGLLDALHEERAVIVGHALGAAVAWNTALMRPDRVRGVVALSLPFAPRGPVSPLSAWRSALGDGFYMAYFLQPAVADSELGRDARTSLLSFLFAASGEGRVEGAAQPVVPKGWGMLDVMSAPERPPAWLSPHDLDQYAAEFARTGFTGGLNWYRAMERSWELMAPFQGAHITTPSLYIAGDRDLVVDLPGMRQAIANMPSWVSDLTSMPALPECGHWTQQERPAEVNAALLEFLRGR